MPTDLQMVFAHRSAAREEKNAHTTLILACVSVTLAVLVLLSMRHTFAQAVELLGEIVF